MDNRREKKVTFITIGLIFLLSGVEYGKISSAIKYQYWNRTVGRVGVSMGR